MRDVLLHGSAPPMLGSVGPTVLALGWMLN